MAGRRLKCCSCWQTTAVPDCDQTALFVLPLEPRAGRHSAALFWAVAILALLVAGAIVICWRYI
jgi:hypothetical protein